VRLQSAASIPQGMFGNTVVYLAEDAGLPFDWRGKYWPEKEGWQWVSRPMGDTTWWYVWPAGAWKDLERMQRKERAREEAGREGRSGERTGGEGTAGEGRERVEFPKGWFFCLFLLGAVFLWVERKMGGMSG
jgi:hypothetical protein